jgi:phosphohistidine phosphatase SixA
MMRPFQLAITLWLCCVGTAAADPALWQALRSGQAVALVRHAEAPGTGDPPGFRLDACVTQRNLSPAGQAQAVRLGQQFRANDVANAEIRSSEWCRCRDTAAALGLGPVQVAPALNSLFGRSQAMPAATEALRRLIDGLPPGPAVLVSHQANITGLTGIYPGSGEVIVVARRGYTVLGRLVVD